MVGCRFNAKNTLTKNYLYLAEQRGLTILPERQVTDVKPCGNQDGTRGYRVTWRSTTSLVRTRGEFTCRGVVFAGGVLGTVPLLLKLKQRSLPDLSDMVGRRVRTNSESLFGVTAYDRDRVFSDGIAISSILHTDGHTHLEPVRYPAGSGFWRMLQAPLVPGRNFASRLARMIIDFVRHPVTNLKVLFVDDWAKRTQILLFMRTLDSTLWFSRGLFGLRTSLEQGAAPRALEPEALELAEQYGRIVKGKAHGPPERIAPGDTHDRAHPGRRSHGQRPVRGRHRQGQPRLRVREPLRLRRLHDLGQSRRESSAHDHGPGRAGHEQGASETALTKLLLRPLF
jgi:cholesterol oxidase